MLNELCLLCGRTFTEVPPESPRAERGGSLGVRAGGGWNGRGAGHSGSEVGVLGPQFTITWDGRGATFCPGPTSPDAPVAPDAGREHVMF